MDKLLALFVILRRVVDDTAILVLIDTIEDKLQRVWVALNNQIEILKRDLRIAEMQAKDYKADADYWEEKSQGYYKRQEEWRKEIHDLNNKLTGLQYDNDNYEMVQPIINYIFNTDLSIGWDNAERLVYHAYWHLGWSKVKTIRALRQLTGLGIKESKDMVEKVQPTFDWTQNNNCR